MSHYNPLTNRCYVERHSQRADSSKPLVVDRFLYDGQTGELLASFEANCNVLTQQRLCQTRGLISGEGVAMRQANKVLGNTDNETVHDSASDAEAFINNVMADDRSGDGFRTLYAFLLRVAQHGFK